MDIESLKGQVTAVVAGQLARASDDPTVSAAGDAVAAGIEYEQRRLANGEERQPECVRQTIHHQIERVREHEHGKPDPDRQPRTWDRVKWDLPWPAHHLWGG